MEMEKQTASHRFDTAPYLAEIKVINSSNPPSEKVMTSNTRTRDPLMKRLFRWLVPDQRVANRHTMPPLIAYLGLVRSSKEYKVGDISVAGFYMITEERWIVGTSFPVTLERTDALGEGQNLTLHSTVVRIGEDGVGFTFVQPMVDEEAAGGQARGSMRLDLTKLAQFLKGIPLVQLDSNALEHVS